MFLSEAHWIKEQLEKIPEDQLYPIINVGSSTLEARRNPLTNFQEILFDPLEMKGLVIHADIREGEGINISGNLKDKEFIDRIKKIQPATVLCNNLLEHIEGPHEIARSLLDVTKPGGHILVSVPYRYPYHYDPIDTMFRPSPNGILELFPNATMVTGEIINDHRTYFDKLKNDPYLARIIFFRSFLPFYKPKMWWYTVSYLPNMFKRFQVSCALLRKNHEGTAYH